jgi:hypothetical protein
MGGYKPTPDYAKPETKITYWEWVNNWQLLLYRFLEIKMNLLITLI